MLTIACGAQLTAADGGVTSGPPSHVSQALRDCAEKPRAVSSIRGLVEAINGLPRPVSIPCVIASLPRPLPIVASQSFISAQPAFDRHNPRLFIFEPGLVLSVVPTGDGAPFLEMGEWISRGRTIKGELLMPVSGPVTPEAPFERVLYSPGHTSCGFCHRGEAAHATIAGAYVSDAFRPAENTLVPLALVEAEHQACIDTPDAPDAGDRCALFHALFDFGSVDEAAFDPKVDLFQP